MATAPETPASESTALTKPEPGGAVSIPIDENGIRLQSLDDLLKFARRIVDDKAAPDGMSIGAVAIAIQASIQANLGILAGLQLGKVINQRFGWMGEGVIALLEKSPIVKRGSLDFWFEAGGKRSKTGDDLPLSDDFRAVVTAWRVGYVEPFVSVFSVQDAKTAGLYPQKQDSPSPWRKYPRRMLKWRALGFLGKDRFPDVLLGIPLAEELEDHPEMTARVVSPSNEARALPPPPGDDPLNELIFGGKRPAAEPAIIEVEAVRPSPEVAKVEVLPAAPDDGLDDDPPFESHEEADRELAREDEKQAGLFDTKRDSRLR